MSRPAGAHLGVVAYPVLRHRAAQLALRARPLGILHLPQHIGLPYSHAIGASCNNSCGNGKFLVLLMSWWSALPC